MHQTTIFLAPTLQEELSLVCPYHTYYHDLNLGLMTKARACKAACQEGSPGITFHIHENVRESEGMNPQTPKWALTLGIRIPMES